MRKIILYVFIPVLLYACSKEDKDEDIWYEARVCYMTSNCENFLYIDYDSEPGTDFRAWPINLPNEYVHTDKVCKIAFIKFEMLQDSFHCQRHTVGVGSPYFSFRKIELLDIKRE